MTYKEFENKIMDLRPHYSEKYRDMIDRISNKGEKLGVGNIAQFGPIYQTFMYACVIGIRLGAPKYLEKGEPSYEFALIDKWKPNKVRDFVLMLIFNRTQEFGYDWMNLENAPEETIGNFTSAFNRELEGYANRGFEYLQEKWDNEKVIFNSPQVFVDILLQLGKNI